MSSRDTESASQTAVASDALDRRGPDPSPAALAQAARAGRLAPRGERGRQDRRAVPRRARGDRFVWDSFDRTLTIFTSPAGRGWLDIDEYFGGGSAPAETTSGVNNRVFVGSKNAG